MDTYKEEIASFFKAGIPTMLPDQALNATTYLKGYLAQQEENMLPPWPSQLAAEAAEKKKMWDIFRDPKLVDTHYPRFNPNTSADPDLSRKMLANSVFIAGHIRTTDGGTMQPHEVAANRELLRDTVAKQLFSATGPVDDATFYSMAQGQMAKEKKRDDDFDAAQRAGLEDAYLGDGTDDVARYKKWSDAAKAAGYYNKDTDQAYAETHKAIRESVAPFMEEIDFAMKAMAEHMGVAKNPDAHKEDIMPKGALDFLLELPVPARNAVFNALTVRAREQGKKVGDDKGLKVTAWGEPNVNGFFQQIGESFARTIEDRFSLGSVDDKTLEHISREGKTWLVEGASPEQLIAFAKAQYEPLGAARDDRAIPGGNAPNNPFLGLLGHPMGDKQRDLTAEEKETLSNYATQGKKALQLARKLKAVSRTLDPTPNIMASTLGSSFAFLADYAVLGPKGMATGAWGYANMEYDQLRTEYPTMSTKSAANVAVVSGLVQAPFDLLEGSLLMGKMPFLKDLLKGATAKTLIKRGFVRVVATGLIENVAEGFQDAATPVVQHIMRELDANIQGVNAEEKMTEWYKGRATVAIGMLPLMLIGVTVGSVQDIKQRNLFNILSEDEVRKTGVSEEVVVAVGEARAAGDLQGAVDAYRAGISTANKERAQAAVSKQMEDGAKESEAELMVARLQRSGASPRFSQIEDGSVQVQMPDNSLFVVPDAASAEVQVSRWYDEQENKDIHEMKSLAAEFADAGAPALGLPGGLQETFTVAGRPQTTQQDVEQKLATPEEVAIGVMDAGARLDLTPEQATENLNMVFGRNTTEVKDNIAHSASVVYDGANVLDVVRETVGGRVKAALATGAKKVADFQRVIDNVFEATGVQFLKGDTEGHMVEAMGHLAAADVLGRRRDVGGIGGATQDTEGKVVPGSITKGLSALLNKVGNNSARGKEVSRSKHILDTFRAYFKTVFQHAKALKKAHADGKITADSRQTLDQLLGVDVQQQHVNSVVEEAKGFMEEASVEEETAKAFSNAKTELTSREKALAAAKAAFEQASLEEEAFATEDALLEEALKAEVELKAEEAKAKTAAAAADAAAADAAVEAEAAVTALTEAKHKQESAKAAAKAAAKARSATKEKAKNAALTASRNFKAAKRLAEAAETKAAGARAVAEILRGEAEMATSSANTAAENFSQAEKRAGVTYSIGSQEMVNLVTDDLQRYVANPQKRMKLMSKLLSRIASVDMTDYDNTSDNIAAAHRRMDHDNALRAAEKAHAVEVAKVKQKADVDVAALVVDNTFDAEQATRDAEAVNQTRLNAAEIEHLDRLNEIDDQAEEAGGSEEAKAFHKQQTKEEKARWKAKKEALKAAHKLRTTITKLRGEGKLKEAKAATLAYHDALVAEADAKLAAQKQKIEARLKIADARGEAQSNKAKVHHDQLAAFRLLDAATLAFPKAIQGEMGPMTRLAQATTNEARAKQIKARAAKLMAAFEKQLHKDLTEQIEGILKAGVGNSAKAGEAPRGKTDADTHQMFVHIKRAAEATEMEQDGLVADQDRIINDPNSSPEQVALADMTKQFIEAVGAMSTKTAAELEAVHEDLALLLTVKSEQALAKRLAEKKARDNYAEQARVLLQLGKLAGGTGRFVFDMLSFDQAFTRLLGNNSFTHDLVDRERNADIARTSEMRSLEARFEHLLERLSTPVRNLRSGFLEDRVLAGRQLRKNLMADKTITPPSQFVEERDDRGNVLQVHEIPILDKAGRPQLLTQMEAVQAVMMFRQPDGRRHMKGLGWRGEGKTNWNYDEKWVAEVEKQLSPEAKAVMKFLTQEYADLHTLINPFYRERYGVNLPLINLYAPLTLQGVGNPNAAASIDPMTGVSLSGKSVMGVNPFKTRSSNAVAEPRFVDAVTTFMGHQREVRHWVHFYELAKDMKAAFENPVARKAIVASNGEGAAHITQQHLERIYTGGVDTKELSAQSKAIGRAASNTAASLILANIQTLLVQPSQTVASAFHMTLAEYTSRLARVGTSISLRNARDSRLMQFRLQALTPVQMARFQEITDVVDPNVLGRVQDVAGRALNAADAYSTMVTYAIVHDHQTLLAQRANPNATAAEVDAIAHTNTERLVEQTAQPLRAAQRSMFELQHSEGAWRVLWPFASEARQKLMFTYEAARLFPDDPSRAGRAVTTFVLMSTVAQIARASFKTLKGDADEDTWDWKTLVLYSTIKNITTGIPIGTIAAGGVSLIKPIGRTWERVVDVWEGDDVSISDVRDILQGLAFSDTRISGAASLLNPIVDLLKVFGNPEE